MFCVSSADDRDSAKLRLPLVDPRGTRARPRATSHSSPTLSIGIHGGDPGAHFEVLFAVPDIDAALAAVTAAGGDVVAPVTDSPGFGRWAECRDDQGVRFGLRQLS